nr:MAG TPA: hypothetical protein [Crassvirales sp.]
MSLMVNLLIITECEPMAFYAMLRVRNHIIL